MTSLCSVTHPSGEDNKGDAVVVQFLHHFNPTIPQGNPASLLDKVLDCLLLETTANCQPVRYLPAELYLVLKIKGDPYNSSMWGIFSSIERWGSNSMGMYFLQRALNCSARGGFSSLARWSNRPGLLQCFWPCSSLNLVRVKSKSEMT